jgi:hypothetical protein
MIRKGCRRNLFDIIWGTILEFIWKDWGKPRIIWVKIIGSLVEIRTGHFPNTEVGFEVLNAVSMKNNIFWNVTLCRLVEVYRRFKVTYCLHLQSRLSKGRGHQVMIVACFLLASFLAYWRSSKTSGTARLQAVTLQKIVHFTSPEALPLEPTYLVSEMFWISLVYTLRLCCVMCDIR